MSPNAREVDLSKTEPSPSAAGYGAPIQKTGEVITESLRFPSKVISTARTTLDTGTVCGIAYFEFAVLNINGPTAMAIAAGIVGGFELIRRVKIK